MGRHEEDKFEKMLRRELKKAAGQVEPDRRALARIWRRLRSKDERAS